MSVIFNSKETQDYENLLLDLPHFDSRRLREHYALKISSMLDSILEDHHLKASDVDFMFVQGLGKKSSLALALARQLIWKGLEVNIFFPIKSDELSIDLKEEIETLKHLGQKIYFIEEVDDFHAFFENTHRPSVFIDGLLGVGVRFPLPKVFVDVMRVVNKFSDLSISLDIPSGLCPETGRSGGAFIKADTIVSVGPLKQGLFMQDAAKYSQDIRSVEVENNLAHKVGSLKATLSRDSYEHSLLERDRFADKKIFGHSLVIGGSHGLTGAVALASRASLKVGAGLVTAATWEPQYNELIVRLIPEVMTGYIPLNQEEWPRLIQDLEKYSSIVIGPGLAQSDLARTLVLTILTHYKGPLILDADAINVLTLKEDGDLIKKRKAPTLMTPHLGEFCHFTGLEYEVVKKESLHYLTELVNELGCTILLKGPCTMLGLSDGRVLFNYYPNDGMATAGVGDVLAGLIGGLVGQEEVILREQKLSLQDHYALVNQKIALGLRIHTKAGLHAQENRGVRAMTASTVIDSFSYAFDVVKKEVGLA